METDEIFGRPCYNGLWDKDNKGWIPLLQRSNLLPGYLRNNTVNVRFKLAGVQLGRSSVFLMFRFRCFRRLLFQVRCGNTNRNKKFDIGVD